MLTWLAKRKHPSPNHIPQSTLAIVHYMMNCVLPVMFLLHAKRLHPLQTACAESYSIYVGSNIVLFLLLWYSAVVGGFEKEKVTSSVSHVVLHRIRQALAHTNDIEIN